MIFVKTSSHNSFLDYLLSLKILHSKYLEFPFKTQLNPFLSFYLSPSVASYHPTKVYSSDQHIQNSLSSLRQYTLDLLEFSDNQRKTNSFFVLINLNI